MTMRERFRAMFVPELMAAYRMRDTAQDALDAALDHAAEAERALAHEKVYSSFWQCECSASDRKFILLVKAVEEAGDPALIRKARAILDGETA